MPNQGVDGFSSPPDSKTRAPIYFQDWFNTSVYYLPDFSDTAVVRVSPGTKLPISTISASEITSRLSFYVHYSLLLSLLLYKSGGKKSLELQMRCGWTSETLLPAQLLILLISLAFQRLQPFHFQQDS